MTNTVYGNAGNNTLSGTAGDDLIDGRAGTDTMSGGAGDDSYYVDTRYDVVVELAGDGIDTVFARVDYSEYRLSANVENLVSIGSLGPSDLYGNALDNTITGDRQSNFIDGGLGADAMSGGGGDDSYIVDNAGDTVTDSGAGYDYVYSSVSFTLGANLEWLALTGTGRINATGNALANTLLGNDNANVLDGQGGADTLRGKAGNDTYVIDNAGDTVTEDAAGGIDTVVAGIAWTLGDNLEKLILSGTAAIDGTGNDLANALTGNAADNVLDGRGGADVMRGGLGNDSYIVDNAADSIAENANAGTDTVRATVSYTLRSNLEDLVLLGAAVKGTGNTQANHITGNDAANVIDGRVGADTMAGGQGNDTYFVDNAGDTTVELAGAGYDTVQATRNWTLADNLERLILLGSAVNGTGNALANVIAGNALANLLDGGAGADTLQGGAGDDTYIVDNAKDAAVELAGNGTDTVRASVSYRLGANVENLELANDALNIATNGFGNALDNHITGSAADNFIDGGAGADTMEGGEGIDTYIVDNAGDVVIETGTRFGDTIKSSVSYTLPDKVEKLILTGTANINGTGTSGHDEITGNSGDNVLDGGGGSDYFAGGAGNDTYIVADGESRIKELKGGGIDTVYSGGTYLLEFAGQTENLVLTGTGDFYGFGNSLDNVITGNSGNNILHGMGGADTLVGGAGNDDYRVLSAAVTIVEKPGEGTDIATVYADYTLPENVENMWMVSGKVGTGNAVDNTITGNFGDNVIDGKGGADDMIGFYGNDVYYVDNPGDVVEEIENGWTDTVYASVDYTLTPYVEKLFLTGSARAGTGNAMDNSITGTDGADVLDGKAGRDTLAGGLGDDTYKADRADDIVIEAAGAGTDTVIAANTDFVLGANLENLILTGMGRTAGGNDLDNTITGNDAGDLIDGGAGADTMTGGAGDDTFVVDNAGDVVIEAVGGGTDLVRSGITYTLAANLENLALTGAAAIDGTGNGDANQLTGNGAANHLSGLGGNDALAGGGGDDTLDGGAGADTLDGGAGADTMRGGAGDDIYLIDSAGDTVAENAGEGHDTVRAALSATLGANVEDLVLLGAANLNGTGNAQANTITGNAGNNVIDGGAGADHLIGGGGTDTFVVDDAGDTVDGAGLVRAAVSFTLTGANDLALTGSAAINGTGNANANHLTGNDAANHLDGRAGDDVLDGGGGDDTLSGGDGADQLSGGDGADGLTGGAGDDVLDGGAGNDTLSGGDGVDRLSGGDGADTLIGGAGGDIYTIGAGDSVEEAAGGGTDVVRTSASFTLSANIEVAQASGDGAINLTGAADANALVGNAAANVLDGADGDDTLVGFAGNDTLRGGNGADLLLGGAGVDSMTGGAGGDTFVVWTTDPGAIDTITDFVSGTDRLLVVNTFVSGYLLPGGFVNGTSAHDEDDIAIYDKGSGRLYVDYDANGPQDKVLLAQFTPGTNLASGDIQLIFEGDLNAQLSWLGALLAL